MVPECGATHGGAVGWANPGHAHFRVLAGLFERRSSTRPMAGSTSITLDANQTRTVLMALADHGQHETADGAVSEPGLDGFLFAEDALLKQHPLAEPGVKPDPRRFWAMPLQACLRFFVISSSAARSRSMSSAGISSRLRNDGLAKAMCRAISCSNSASTPWPSTRTPARPPPWT